MPLLRLNVKFTSRGGVSSAMTSVTCKPLSMGMIVLLLPLVSSTVLADRDMYVFLCSVARPRKALISLRSAESKITLTSERSMIPMLL